MYCLTGVMFHTSNVKCQLSVVKYRTSSVICQMSGVMYHLSHVRKGNSKSHPLVRFRVRCQVSGVRCQVLGVRCQVSDVACHLSPVTCHKRLQRHQRTLSLAKSLTMRRKLVCEDQTNQNELCFAMQFRPLFEPNLKFLRPPYLFQFSEFFFVIN